MEPRWAVPAPVRISSTDKPMERILKIRQRCGRGIVRTTVIVVVSILLDGGATAQSKDPEALVHLLRDEHGTSKKPGDVLFGCGTTDEDRKALEVAKSLVQIGPRAAAEIEG